MKKGLKKSILAGALVVAVAAAGFTGMAIKGHSPVAVNAAGFGHHKCGGFLHVAATESVKVSPDFAVINLNIETKNKEIKEAQAENAERVQSLIAALEDEGITESDIKTAGFYIYPEYDYNYGQQFTGFRVSNQIAVRVADIKSVGQILDIATESGANNISGIQFAVEDDSEIYKSALAKAITAAKEKARLMADTADIDAIKIVSVKEITNGYSGYSNMYATTRFADYKTSIMHGDIEVSASVQITYTIEPRTTTDETSPVETDIVDGEPVIEIEEDYIEDESIVEAQEEIAEQNL